MGHGRRTAVVVHDGLLGWGVSVSLLVWMRGRGGINGDLGGGLDGWSSGGKGRCCRGWVDGIVTVFGGHVQADGVV